MPDKVWDEITYPFPNFNGCTIEVWEWISNFSETTKLWRTNADGSQWCTVDRQLGFFFDSLTVYRKHQSSAILAICEGKPLMTRQGIGIFHSECTFPFWFVTQFLYLNQWKRIDDLLQDCSISNANARQIQQACTKPSKLLIFSEK